MKNQILFSIIFGLLTVPLFAQTMTLNHSLIFKKKQRAQVDFPHDVHLSADTLSCKSCHHLYNDKEENILDEGTLEEGKVNCAACHVHATPSKLEKAFHGQCIPCHINYRKAKKKSGPESCGKCHPKKRIIN